MLTASRTKWIASLILGGILVVLALVGGKWQTTYAADAGVNQVPVIDHIYPSKAPAGSDNLVMIIMGSNFGQVEDFIRVWLEDADHNYTAAPIEVIDTALSVVITDTLMVAPDFYSIRVVKSNGLSVPTIPPDPIYDQVSNAVEFEVYAPLRIFLPVMDK